MTGSRVHKVLAGVVVAMGVVCVALLTVCISLFVSKGRKGGTTEDVADSYDAKTESVMDEDPTEGQTDEQDRDDDEYSVTFWLVDSTTVSSEEGTAGSAIPSANISIRDGASPYKGDIIQTAATDSDGQANVRLKPGSYTAQISADGYNTMHYALEVDTEDVLLNLYAAPTNNDSKKTIVLTWDNPDYDLDLTIFTPYQDNSGDTAYIGSGILSDDHGNYILSDNSGICEVAYIDTTNTGDYKIYVNNYTDTQSGNLNSSALSEANAHVYIYADNEQTADYTIPTGTKGVVWEVTEINGTTYQPCQMVYNDVSDRKCWNRDKTASDTSSDEALYASYFNREVGALQLYSDYSVYYNTTEYAYLNDWEEPEINWFDLDNDGKDEPYWDDISSGMTAIDARDGILYVIAEGNGTAVHSSYTVYNGETYLVTSDTTHAGRQDYYLRKINGNGDTIDEFDLSAEYWDEPDDRYDENSDFSYRGQKITMEEYESLRYAYFGY